MSRRQSLDRPGILSPPGPFLTPSPSPSISASPRLQPSPSLSPFPQDVLLVSGHSLTNATTYEQERKTLAPGRRQSIHQFASSSPNAGTVVFQPSPSQSPAAATSVVGVTTGGVNVVAANLANIGSTSTTQTTATGLDLNTTLVGSNNIQLNKKGTKRQQQQQQQHIQIFNNFGQQYNNNNSNSSNTVVGVSPSLIGGHGQSHISTSNSTQNTFATTNVACSPKGQTKKAIASNNGANNAAVLTSNQLKQQQKQQQHPTNQTQHPQHLQQFNNNNSPLIADSPSPTPNSTITAATIKPTTPQPMQMLPTATTFTNNSGPCGGGGHTFQIIQGPQGQLIAATTTTQPHQQHQQQLQQQQQQQRFNNGNINATLIPNINKSTKTPQQILPKPHQQQQQQHMQSNFDTYPQSQQQSVTHQITIAQQHSNQINNAIIQTQQQQQHQQHSQSQQQKSKNITTNNSSNNSNTDNAIPQAMATHITHTTQPTTQQAPQQQQQILIPSGSTTSLTTTQQPLLLNQMPVLVQQNTAQGVQLILRPPTPQHLTATPSLVIQNARPQPQLQAQQQPQQLLRILGTNGATMQLAAGTPTFIVSSQANLLQQGTNLQTIKTNPQTPAITQISGLHAALSAAAAANAQPRSQQFTTTAATINGHILGPSMATHLQNLQIAAAAAAANGNSITAQIQMPNGLNSSAAPTLLSQLPTAQFSQGTTQGLINFSQLSGTNLHQLAAAAAAVSVATTTFQASAIPTQAPTNVNGNNTATSNTSNIITDIFNTPISANLTNLTQSSPMHTPMAALTPEPLTQPTPGSGSTIGTQIQLNLNATSAAAATIQMQQQQQQVQIHQLQQQIQQTQNQVQQAQKQAPTHQQQPVPAAALAETTKKKSRPRKKKQPANTTTMAATTASNTTSRILNTPESSKTVNSAAATAATATTLGNTFNVITSMAYQTISKIPISNSNGNITVPYSFTTNTATSTLSTTVTSLSNLPISQNNSNSNNVTHGNVTTAAAAMQYNSQLTTNHNINTTNNTDQKPQQHSKTSSPLPSPPPQITRASNGKLDLGNVMKLCGIMEDDDDDCDDYAMDTIMPPVTVATTTTTAHMMNDSGINAPSEISITLPQATEYQQKIDDIQPFTLTIPGYTTTTNGTATGTSTNGSNQMTSGTDNNSATNIVIKIDASGPNLGAAIPGGGTPYSITIPTLPGTSAVQNPSLKAPLNQQSTNINFSLPSIHQTTNGLLNGPNNNTVTLGTVPQSLGIPSTNDKTVNINQNSSSTTVNTNSNMNPSTNNVSPINATTTTTSMATVKPRRKPPAKRNVKKSDVISPTIFANTTSTTNTVTTSSIITATTNNNANHQTTPETLNNNNFNNATMMPVSATTLTTPHLLPSHIGNIQISQIDSNRFTQNTITSSNNNNALNASSLSGGNIGVVDNKIQIMPILNKITTSGTTAATQNQASLGQAQQQILFQNNHANVATSNGTGTVLTTPAAPSTLIDNQMRQMQLLALANNSSNNNLTMNNVSSTAGSLTITQTTTSTTPPIAVTNQYRVQAQSQTQLQSLPQQQLQPQPQSQTQSQISSLTTENVSVSLSVAPAQTSLAALIPQLTGSLSLAVSEHCERLILRHDPNQPQDQQSQLIMQALLKGALPNVTIINEPLRADNINKLMVRTSSSTQLPLTQLTATLSGSSVNNHNNNNDNNSNNNSTTAGNSLITGTVSKHNRKVSNCNNVKSGNANTATLNTPNENISKQSLNNSKTNSNIHISVSTAQLASSSTQQSQQQHQQRYVALPRIDSNTQQLFCLNTINNHITPIGANQTTASIAPTERLLIAPAGINAEQLAQCLQQGQIHFNDVNSAQIVEQTLTTHTITTTTSTITTATTTTTTTTAVSAAAATTLIQQQQQQPKQQIVHPLSNNLTVTATITTTIATTTISNGSNLITTITSTTKQVANVAPIIDQSKTGGKQNITLGGNANNVGGSTNINNNNNNTSNSVPKKKPVRRPKASTTTAADVALMKNATLVKPLPKLDPLSQKPNNNPVQIVPPNTASGKPVATVQTCGPLTSTTSSLTTTINTNVASVQPFQTMPGNNNGTKLIGVTAPMQQQPQIAANVTQQQQQQAQTQQSNNLNIQSRPQLNNLANNFVSTSIANPIHQMATPSPNGNVNGNFQNNLNLLTNGPPSLASIGQQQQQQQQHHNQIMDVATATSSTPTSASTATNTTTVTLAQQQQQNQQPQHTVSRVQTIQLTPQQQQMFRLVQMQIQYLTYKMQHKSLIASLPLPPEYDPNVIAPFNKAMKDYEINAALQRLFIEQQSILATGKEIPTPEGFITNAPTSSLSSTQPPMQLSSTASSSSLLLGSTTNINFITQMTAISNNGNSSNNNNNNVDNNVSNIPHILGNSNLPSGAMNNTKNNSNNISNRGNNNSNAPNTNFQQQLTQRIHIYPIQHQQQQQQNQQSQNKSNNNNYNKKTFQQQQQNQQQLITTTISTVTNSTITTIPLSIITTATDQLMTTNTVGNTISNYSNNIQQQQHQQQQIKFSNKPTKVTQATTSAPVHSMSISSTLTTSTAAPSSSSSLPSLLQQSTGQFSQPPPLTQTLPSPGAQTLPLSLSPLLPPAQGHGHGGANHSQMINISNMPAILQQKHFTQHLQQQILQQQQQKQQKIQNAKPPLLKSLSQATSFANVAITAGTLNSSVATNSNLNVNNSCSNGNNNNINGIVAGTGTNSGGGPPPLIFPNTSVVLTQQTQQQHSQITTTYQQQQQQVQPTLSQTIAQIPVQTMHLQQSNAHQAPTFAISLTTTQKNLRAMPTTSVAATICVNSNNYRSYHNNSNNNNGNSATINSSIAKITIPNNLINVAVATATATATATTITTLATMATTRNITTGATATQMTTLSNRSTYTTTPLEGKIPIKTTNIFTSTTIITTTTTTTTATAMIRTLNISANVNNNNSNATQNHCTVNNNGSINNNNNNAGKAIEKLTVQSLNDNSIPVIPIVVGLKIDEPNPMSPKQKLARLSLFLRQLEVDQKSCLNADYKTPFQSTEDTVKRLIRYHCLYQNDEDIPSDEEDGFECTGLKFKDKFRLLTNKFQQVILQQSMLPHPTAESCQMEQLLIDDLKAEIEEARRLEKLLKEYEASELTYINELSRNQNDTKYLKIENTEKNDITEYAENKTNSETIINDIKTLSSTQQHIKSELTAESNISFDKIMKGAVKMETQFNSNDNSKTYETNIKTEIEENASKNNTSNCKTEQQVGQNTYPSGPLQMPLTKAAKKEDILNAWHAATPFNRDNKSTNDYYSHLANATSESLIAKSLRCLPNGIIQQQQLYEQQQQQQLKQQQKKLIPNETTGTLIAPISATTTTKSATIKSDFENFDIESEITPSFIMKKIEPKQQQQQQQQSVKNTQTSVSSNLIKQNKEDAKQFDQQHHHNLINEKVTNDNNNKTIMNHSNEGVQSETTNTDCKKLTIRTATTTAEVMSVTSTIMQPSNHTEANHFNFTENKQSYCKDQQQQRAEDEDDWLCLHKEFNLLNNDVSSTVKKADGSPTPSSSKSNSSDQHHSHSETVIDKTLNFLNEATTTTENHYHENDSLNKTCRQEQQLQLNQIVNNSDNQHPHQNQHHNHHHNNHNNNNNNHDHDDLNEFFSGSEDSDIQKSVESRLEAMFSGSPVHIIPSKSNNINNDADDIETNLESLFGVEATTVGTTVTTKEATTATKATTLPKLLNEHQMCTMSDKNKTTWNSHNVIDQSFMNHVNHQQPQQQSLAGTNTTEQQQQQIPQNVNTIKANARATFLNDTTNHHNVDAVTSSSSMHQQMSQINNCNNGNTIRWIQNIEEHFTDFMSNGNHHHHTAVNNNTNNDETSSLPDCLMSMNRKRHWNGHIIGTLNNVSPAMENNGNHHNSNTDDDDDNDNGIPNRKLCSNMNHLTTEATDILATTIAAAATVIPSSASSVSSSLSTVSSLSSSPVGQTVATAPGSGSMTTINHLTMPHDTSHAQDLMEAALLSLHDGLGVDTATPTVVEQLNNHHQTDHGNYENLLMHPNHNNNNFMTYHNDGTRITTATTTANLQQRFSTNHFIHNNTNNNSNQLNITNNNNNNNINNSLLQQMHHHHHHHHHHNDNESNVSHVINSITSSSNNNNGGEFDDDITRHVQNAIDSILNLQNTESGDSLSFSLDHSIGSFLSDGILDERQSTITSGVGMHELSKRRHLVDELSDCLMVNDSTNHTNAHATIVENGLLMNHLHHNHNQHHGHHQLLAQSHQQQHNHHANNITQQQQQQQQQHIINGNPMLMTAATIASDIDVDNGCQINGARTTIETTTTTVPAAVASIPLDNTTTTARHNINNFDCVINNINDDAHIKSIPTS